MNYFKLYIGDYERDTGHLSLAEDGAYGRLLRHYYASELALPAEIAALYRIARAFSAAERKAVDTVIAQFFNLTPDGFVNGRASNEIPKAQNAIGTARTNGVKGGRPKKPSGLSKNNPAGSVLETQRVPKNNPEGTQKESSPNTIQKLSTSDPNGSGVPPPETDPVKDIFDTGVALLGKVGVGEKAARALVGRLRMAKGDPQAMAVLIEARSKTDPQAYIGAAINPKADKTGYVPGKGHTRVAL